MPRQENEGMTPLKKDTTMTRKSGLKVCAAVLMLTGAVWAGKPAINYWTDYQLEYGITDRLAFTAEQENWYDTDRFYLEETILMAKVKVFDWFSVAVGDRFVDEREVHDGKRQWRYENRPTLDLLFKHSYEGFTLDWRNRYEYRDKEGADREWMRFRNRLRLRTPWKWTDWKISPYVSEELYYEDRHGLAKDKRLNQMRSLVGLSMKPAEHVTISVFYLLMHKQSSDRGWQPIHVPGIELKLDF